MNQLEKHFLDQWENPPPPFNSDYKPHAMQVSVDTTQSMEDSGYYDTHDREECRVEWRKRYDARMAEYEERMAFGGAG